MNNLMNYLLSRLDKKTCPITSLEQVIDFSFNSPWREYYVLKFKDGTVIELIEKPKLK